MSTPFTKTAIAALAISFAGSAFAADKANDGLFNKETNFSYSYIEGNIGHFHKSYMNGLNTKGSFAIMPNLSIIGSLGYARQTRSNNTYKNYERQDVTIGASYQRPLSGTSLSKTDYVLHAELEHNRYDTKRPFFFAKTIKEENTGFIIGAGLRSELINNLEVFGDFSLRFRAMTMHSSSLPEARVSPFVTLGARYSVIPNLQVGGSVEVGTVGQGRKRAGNGGQVAPTDDFISANIRYSF